MSAGLYGSSSVPNSALASLLPSSPAPPSGEAAEAGGGAAWLQMAASQLAVQDYLSRVQAASRDPGQLAAASLIPGYEHLLSGNNVNGSSGRKSGDGKKSKSGATNILDNLKLPSDTEIVKSVGSGVTIKNKVVDSRSENTVSIPNIPPGLTIERKKPGRKPLDPNYHIPTSGQVIDKVEITKIPLSNGSASIQAPLDMTKGRVEDDTAGDAPLNLSMKADSGSDACEPPALTIKRKSSVERDTGGKIPSDYYACEYIEDTGLIHYYCHIVTYSPSTQRSVPRRADSTTATCLGASQSSPELKLQPDSDASPAQPGK